MSQRNPFLASNFTKNIFLIIDQKVFVFYTFGSIIQKISICIKNNKKVVPKLVSLDDIWQISEFLTKNCFC